MFIKYINIYLLNKTSKLSLQINIYYILTVIANYNLRLIYYYNIYIYYIICFI